MANQKKDSLKVIAGAPDKPLIISGVEISCYVLEDEMRVFSQRGLTGAIGLNPDAGFRMPQLMGSNVFKSIINKDLDAGLKSPILFKNPVGGGNIYGYPATILPDICKVVLEARRQGLLHPKQEAFAERCQMLIEGLATVGVIALVDEATGYQEIREKRALATILEKYIAKEMQPWTKTFQIEFYQQICRLREWPNVYAIKRPSVIGKYTNDIVYERLAPGVMDELRKQNPMLPAGYRANKHHQWFTPEFGHPKLREHLSAVIALMVAATSWEGFKRSLTKVFPKHGEQTILNLPESDED